MPDLLAVYRISSGGYAKLKPAYITKENCLRNFLRTVKAYDAGRSDGWTRVAILADMCTPELMDAIRGAVSDLELTSKCLLCELRLGSGAQSFNFACVTLAKCKMDPLTTVYMVEDDYLHTPGALGVMRRGLDLEKFVTGYDHPDKYGRDAFGKPSKTSSVVTREYPRSHESGCGLMFHEGRHYRQTLSTTMTFMCRLASLTEAWLPMMAYTSRTHPHDFQLWLDVCQRLDTRIAVPIPGVSTHGESEWLGPCVDWAAVGGASEASASAGEVSGADEASASAAAGAVA